MRKWGWSYMPQAVFVVLFSPLQVSLIGHASHPVLLEDAAGESKTISLEFQVQSGMVAAAQSGMVAAAQCTCIETAEL